MTFRSTLDRDRFVVTAELQPPRGTDATAFRVAARDLAGVVDAVNVTDCAGASVRMSSLAGSLFAKNEGIEPIFQIVCRDRNRLALQADLLGAAALGIENVLVLGGDPPSVGDHPESKAVFDLDTHSLIGLVSKLREGVLLNGKELKGAPDFFIGSIADMFRDPVDVSLSKLEAKGDHGADFIQTQAVYDVERFAAWFDHVRDRGLAKRLDILAGVIPLKSARTVDALARIPGVAIPDAVAKRVREAADPAGEGIAIATEAVRALRQIPGLRGVHLMPVAWPEAVPEIARAARLGSFDQAPEPISTPA